MPNCQKVSKWVKTHQDDASLIKNHVNQLMSGDPGPAGTQAHVLCMHWHWKFWWLVRDGPRHRQGGRVGTFGIGILENLDSWNFGIWETQIRDIWAFSESRIWHVGNHNSWHADNLKIRVLEMLACWNSVSYCLKTWIPAFRKPVFYMFKHILKKAWLPQLPKHPPPQGPGPALAWAFGVGYLGIWGNQTFFKICLNISNHDFWNA